MLSATKDYMNNDTMNDILKAAPEDLRKKVRGRIAEAADDAKNSPDDAATIDKQARKEIGEWLTDEQQAQLKGTTSQVKNKDMRRPEPKV